MQFYMYFYMYILHLFSQDKIFLNFEFTGSWFVVGQFSVQWRIRIHGYVHHDHIENYTPFPPICDFTVVHIQNVV